MLRKERIGRGSRFCAPSEALRRPGQSRVRSCPLVRTLSRAASAVDVIQSVLESWSSGWDREARSPHTRVPHALFHPHAALILCA
jgi:hypothetical protein